MPHGDGKGPSGMGPMTGRAAGFCAGYSVPGYINPIPRGGGFRREGRGWRNRYYTIGHPGWMRARMGYPAWDAGVSPYPPILTLPK